MHTTAYELAPGTMQMGAGEPLLLFHGVLGAPIMWRAVMPLLAAEHRTVALPALGHQGGHPPRARPVRVVDLVDDAERALDTLGFERAHLAGNSLGAWVALELSRRRRALSVCALSPAGMWTPRSRDRSRVNLRATLTLTPLMRPVLPVTARLAFMRKLALSVSAVHGERTSRADLIALADAVIACSVAEDLLNITEQFTELAVTCPTDVAWAAQDRVFPPRVFAPNARERVPGARHFILESVGHVPMLDDPGLVAQTILNTVARTRDADREASSA